MQVARWGNSLAVRLPAAVVRELQLREGDEIEIVALERQRWAVRPASAPVEALRAVRRLRGRLPADFHFEREQAHERG
ncbi:AbrB/MazE/SpoVT family DNA-binding domain-containing protein [Tepidimonas ignava]|nr:AbrB/MazE/SpoVT family DNA-binding domain-containing protein [Tepidimonas ignava]